MPREPAYLRNFKEYAKSDLTSADIPKWEGEVYGGNDRSTIVMLSAMVETCLEIFLRNKARPTLNSDDTRLLFDLRGPLGDFSSKIFVAYAFNLFGPETRHDLDLIRTLRNGFAHSRKSFGFVTNEVSEVCQKLKAVDWPGAVIPTGYLNAIPNEALKSAAQLRSNPKTCYVTSCHVIAERLLLNADSSPIHGIAPPELF
jgi:DNA-binding MltR family transcriptional regulator